MNVLFNWLVVLIATAPTDGIDSPCFLSRPLAQEFVASDFPLQWSPETKGGWQAQLPGKGQSSPVVWHGIAFLTSIEGSMKEKCWVSAVSIDSGQLLWSTPIDSAHPLRSNYFQCRAASTPVVDQLGVVAFFETGNLVALDQAGSIRWQIDLQDKYGPFESTIGLAASLAQLDTQVFALVDHEGESYLLALDKRTGDENWRTERFSRTSYASPTLISIDGNPQIVCSSEGSVDGYDPHTGEMLWTFEEIGANSQNTPIEIGDGLFLVGASPGMHDARENDARTSNLCLRVTKSGDSYETQVVWRTDPKVMSHFASPIHHQGLAYWVTKAGALYCYRVETGDLVYRERIAAGQCWVTPIAIGERIYFFGKDGQTSVIAAGEQFKVLAENQLWDPAEAAANAPGQFGGGRPGAIQLGASRPGASATEQDHEHGNLNRVENASAELADSAKSFARQRPSTESANEAEEAPASRRGPPMSDAEQASALEKGENRFADPVQYGAVLTDNGFLVRSGEILHYVTKGTTE